MKEERRERRTRTNVIEKDKKGGGLRVQIRGANNRGPVQSYFHWRVTSVNARSYRLCNRGYISEG